MIAMSGMSTKWMSCGHAININLMAAANGMGLATIVKAFEVEFDSPWFTLKVGFDTRTL